MRYPGSRLFPPAPSPRPGLAPAPRTAPACSVRRKSPPRATLRGHSSGARGPWRRCRPLPPQRSAPPACAGNPVGSSATCGRAPLSWLAAEDARPERGERSPGARGGGGDGAQGPFRLLPSAGAPGARRLVKPRFSLASGGDSAPGSRAAFGPVWMMPPAFVLLLSECLVCFFVVLFVCLF